MPETKRWERRSEARPAELTAAALAIFAERGFAATRLDDVAARAGVSKATVYLYFKSKEELFEAVVGAAVSPRIEQATALVDAFEGSTANLIRTLVTIFEGALDSPFPAIAKLIVAESSNFPELAKLWSRVALERGMALFRRIIERGIARGEFRPVDSAAVAPLLIAPVMLLGLWQQALAPHTTFVIDRKAVLSAHVEILLRGLAAD
jgi:AcrR family transcriptional regulator